jgi:putative transposase
MGRGGITQKRIVFPPGWGGRRLGAGPKPAGLRAGVSHRTRAALASRFPVHITMRVRPGLPSLRQELEYRVLLKSFRRGCERFGMRLGQFSVQSNHVHLIVEGRDRRSISSGINGLAVRIARGLNRLWDRTGRVFADRYHDRILRSAREVWHALRYVLGNARKHGAWTHRSKPDPYCSAEWFDGWHPCRAAGKGGRVELAVVPGRRRGWARAGSLVPPVAQTRTFLLNLAWRRHGLLRPGDGPGGG